MIIKLDECPLFFSFLPMRDGSRSRAEVHRQVLLEELESEKIVKRHRDGLAVSHNDDGLALIAEALESLEALFLECLVAYRQHLVK